MLPTSELLKNYIATSLNCSYLKVEGDGQHFHAVIVSNIFINKSLIERHQLVYTILGNHMLNEIHALSMKTLTPEEFKK